MTFSPSFGRIFSPSFKPNSLAMAAAASGGWWDLDSVITSCVAAYQPKGADDLADSYINLANPGTYNLTLGSAPAFNASTGWDFSGGNYYLKTGVQNALDQTWSMIIRYTNATSGTLYLAGNYTLSDNAFGLYPYRADNTVRYVSGRTYSLRSVSPQLASGVLAIAGRQGYRDGSAETTTIDSASGIGTVGEIYIGCMNYNNGTPLQYFAGKIQALALYNATLTSTQVGLLTTAMNAL